MLETKEKTEAEKFAKPKIIVVIPARMESGRLPGKPMLEIDGLPMIHQTYNRAVATIADHVIVTTPNREIAQYCEDNSLIWMPTTPDIPNGTHRTAAIIAKMKESVVIDLVVNLQCDEPFINPDDINKLFAFARRNRNYYDVCTLVAEHAWAGAYKDKNVTKAAVSGRKSGTVHWFSRASLAGAMYHCGIYAYSKKALAGIVKKPPTLLSVSESLEQLAFIEMGYRVGALAIENLPRSINTEEDYKEVCNGKNN